MKKSSFIALIMGTVSALLFALGMCMALLPEWNAFTAGIIFGIIGLVCGVITFAVWCKMEHKDLPKVSPKHMLRIVYGIIASLILGVGMCLCLVGGRFILGTLIGLIGILMLLFLIPMIKGLK